MKAKIIFLYIVLMGLLLAYISVPVIMSRDYFFWVILVVIICISCFLIIPDNDSLLRNRILKHSNFLILGIFIVNFQYPIDYVLGYSLPSDTDIWANERVASKSLILSSIGLLSFLIGYLLLSSLAKRGLNRKIVEPTQPLILLKTFSLVSLLIYYYTVNPLYLLGGYGIHEVGSLATYFSVIFTACIIAIVVQCSRNNIINNNSVSLKFRDYLKSLGYSTWIFVFIYLLGVITSGDRGPVIIFGLVIFGGYLNITRKRYGVFILTILILTSIFFINLLGIARSFDSQLSFRERIEIAYTEGGNEEEKSISPNTNELATSIRTLHYSVDYIPDKHNYLLGTLQVNQLIYAIPFASGIYHSFWSEEDLRKYAGISTFITWIIQGDNATYGNGSSVIADFYVAAGLIGIIVGMLFTGWLIRKCEYVMYASRLTPIFWHTFSLVYFSNLIFLGRSSLLEGLKLVVMVLLLITVNRYMSFRGSKTKNSLRIS